MNMNFKRKLPTPQEVKQMYPIDEELMEIKRKNDEEIIKVFTGESNRFILIIGPCSADREDSVIDYIKRLRVVQDKVADQILIIPRIYTNKPRTTCSVLTASSLSNPSKRIKFKRLVFTYQPFSVC